MKCPNCQFENPEDAIFCNGCGKKLELECPKCGKKNPPGSRFCNKCGFQVVAPVEPTPKELSFDEKLEKIQRYLPKGLTEKILSQRERIEGERKQITVMFCDMEGFTALSEQIGPEETYSIMDQVYEILIHKVHDFEGTVNEMTGDGIVALFGAPLALEDAPQRTIRSALAIHREIAKFNDRGREKRRFQPVKMRIGIHTGPVVVGTVGNDLRVEFKAVGDTVNLASRMEKLAQPGTTYVTEDTFKLTEGLFRFEGLGDREIKGKEKPINIYRVLAPSTSRTRFDVSSERGLTPFVGRERELELLLDGFERVKEGRGQAFSIIAEAGLGKSRLLYEFRKTIANENVIFLEGKCLSYSRNVPYHPVIDILKSSFRIRENDGDIDIKNKVKKGLKIIGADETSTLPYLLDLLLIKKSDIDEISMSPDEKKGRIIEALNQNVLKLSEVRPVVMAIEDLHWIDKSSEERFKSLLDNIPGARVCLIFTYRPEFVHTWGGRSYHSQVTLNRLSNRESLAIVAYLLASQDIERNLEEFILDKTEGIPFFVEEFIRSLKDYKGIERKDNMLCLTENQQSVNIPSRIQDVIMARVDALPEEAKNVLQVGSVIGREIGNELLMKIFKFSEQELLSRLSILKDSELLYERGIYPKSTYIFKHALTQETVYQSLLKSTRQKHHHIVAEVLEQQFPEFKESHPEILGRHFLAADLAEKAIPYSYKAGEIAIRHSANVEAVDHLSQGLELLRILPETDESNRRELSFLIKLGSPLPAIRGWSIVEVERIYLRAKDLCVKLGETSQLFIALRGLWNCYHARADYKNSNELSEQLMKLAQSLDEKSYLLGAHRARGADLFWIGDFNESKYHQERVNSFYDPKRHHHLAYLWWTDPKIHSLSYLSTILWFLGYTQQALNKSKEALTLAYKLSHSFSLAIALTFATSLHCLCRDFSKAKEMAETLIQLSSDQKFPIHLAMGHYYRNWMLGIEKKDENAIPKMHEALSTLRAAGIKETQTARLIGFTYVYAHLGRLEEAMRTLTEAESFMNKTGEKVREAELYRLKGEILISQSMVNQNDAESSFHKALTVARRQQAKSLELRAAMSLCRLWQNQGKTEEATRLLSEIYSWFTEGFDTADLIEAKALLDVLS